jgi:two-component system, NarL family, sensor histidine kinase UhpB
MKKVILTFVFSSSCFFISFCQQNKIDSLLNILQTSKEDTNKVKILYQLGQQYLQLNNKADSVLKYSKWALELATSLHYYKMIPKSQLNLGTSYYLLNQFENASNNYRLSLKYSEEYKDTSVMINSLNYLSIVSRQQGNYIIAQQYSLKSLKLSESKKNNKGISITSMDIGHILKNQGDFAGALKYYQNASKYAELDKNTTMTTNSFMSIANIFNEKNNFDSALVYYSKSLLVSEKADYLPGILYNYNNIGIVYEKKGDFENSLKYLFNVLNRNEKLNDDNLLASTYTELGKVYYFIKNKKNAETFLNNGLNLSHKIGSKENIKDCYYYLSSLDSSYGNIKMAYEHYKLYVVYRDSLVNNENTKKIVQAQMQYDFDKREAEIKAAQDKKDAVAKVELDKQKIETSYQKKIKIFAFVLVGIVLIFSFYFLRNIVLKKKIEKDKALLEIREKISMDLHDEIGADNSAIIMKTDFTDFDLLPLPVRIRLNEIKDKSFEIQAALKAVRWALNPENDNLKSLLSFLRIYSTDYLKTMDVIPRFDFPDEIYELPIREGLNRTLYLIVKESLHNILKYSKASEVIISFKLIRANYFNLSIVDNGKGFDFNTAQIGSHKGLYNMQFRAQSMKCKILISANIDQGCKILIEGPL